jgi:hypothetical protein
VERIDSRLAEVARSIVDHFMRHPTITLTTGTGVQPSISVHANLPQRVSLFVGGLSEGEPFIQNYFYLHRGHAPFDQAANFADWKAKLYEITGSAVHLDRTEKAPSFPLRLLLPAGELGKFVGGYDWLVGKIASRN